MDTGLLRYIGLYLSSLLPLLLLALGEHPDAVTLMRGYLLRFVRRTGLSPMWVAERLRIEGRTLGQWRQRVVSSQEQVGPPWPCERGGDPLLEALWRCYPPGEEQRWLEIGELLSRVRGQDTLHPPLVARRLSEALKAYCALGLMQAHPHGGRRFRPVRRSPLRGCDDARALRWEGALRTGFYLGYQYVHAEGGSGLEIQRLAIPDGAEELFARELEAMAARRRRELERITRALWRRSPGRPESCVVVIDLWGRDVAGVGGPPMTKAPP